MYFDEKTDAFISYQTEKNLFKEFLILTPEEFDQSLK